MTLKCGCADYSPRSRNLKEGEGEIKLVQKITYKIIEKDHLIGYFLTDI